MSKVVTVADMAVKIAIFYLSQEWGLAPSEELARRLLLLSAKGNAEAMTNAHLKGKRIHLVTADTALVQLIEETLTPHGVTIFLEETPQKAAVYAMSRPADLLIFDERMPSLDGKDLLVAIRRVAPKIALMIVGEHAHGSYTIDASARGADAVISRQSDKHQVLNAACHAMGLPFERLPGVGAFHGRSTEELTPPKEVMA